ncbi:hypothetical protein BDV06DRAFT_47597 [Aspergillus oleicola]
MDMDSAAVDSGEFLMVVFILGLYELHAWLLGYPHAGHGVGHRAQIWHREEDGLRYGLGLDTPTRILSQQRYCTDGSHPPLGHNDPDLVRFCETAIRIYGSYNLHMLAVQGNVPDAALESLPSQFASHSSYTTDPISLINRSPWAQNLLNTPEAPKSMDVYDNPLFAIDLNLYCATRIHLNLGILEFLDQRSNPHGLAFGNISSLRWQALSTITLLCNQVARSIPGVLQLTPRGGVSDPASPGEIYGSRGYFALWPVVMCMACFYRQPSLDDGSQICWFESVLRFMRDKLGLTVVDAILQRGRRMRGADLQS